MKKTRLEINYDFDFEIFGIISPIKEYKIAWEINRLLFIHLTKEEDLMIEFSGYRNILISTFLYCTEHGEVKLLKNKAIDQPPSSTSAYLLPELKNYDYILKIDGLKETLSSTHILTSLKESPFIHYINKISPQSLKSKDNLLF